MARITRRRNQRSLMRLRVIRAIRGWTDVIMAKKTQKPKASATLTLTGKDKKTLSSIRNLADEVVQSADRGRAPYVEIPSRSLSNVRFNQSKRIQRHQTGIDHRTIRAVAPCRGEFSGLKRALRISVSELQWLSGTISQKNCRDGLLTAHNVGIRDRGRS